MFDPESGAGAPLTDKPIEILHVDDEPAFGELCAEFLELESDRLTVDTATSAVEGLEYVADERPDCIVSDYDMPGMDGLEFLEAVRKRYTELPFILFTGKGSEEIASEAISAGVTDYLQKSRGQDQYRILRNRIRNSVANYRSRQRVRMFRSAVEHSGHSIYITDTDGVIEYVNPSFTDITGYTAEEAVGRTPEILKSGEHGAEFYDDLWETILGGDVWENEIINRRKSGELYVADQTIAPILVGDSEPEKFVAVNQEITDRKTYQLALQRQCENLGALNRMLRYRIRDDLQAVTGYAELLENHVDDNGTEYLHTLEEHAWDVFDQIDAAQSFADLLHRTDADDPMELQRVLQNAVRNVGSIGENVTVTVDETVSSIPIADEAVLRSIVRILVKNAVRYRSGPSEIRVSATDRDQTLAIEVRADDRAELDGTVDRQSTETVQSPNIPGVDGSERHILQGLTDSYGGEIRIADDRADGFGFTVQLPVDRLLSESVRSS
jgi:PAS domain S-box-containing protein